MNPTVVKAISGIEESAWVPIQYPNAIWDHDEQRFISDAQVAEVPFTAFTSRRQSEHISARLIVRRVKRLNPNSSRKAKVSCSPRTATTACSPTPH